MSKKIIKFNKNHEWIPDMQPAKTEIPEWWRKGVNLPDGKVKLIDKNIQAGFKPCIPFFDSLASGYILKTWADINIEIIDGFPVLQYSGEDYVGFERSPEMNATLPTPTGCYPNHHVWIFPYYLQVPKGYSCLITQPFNRDDLPFVSLTGIVDNDDYIMGTGLYPFFVKHGFEGVIPKGTPILQVFPFKRENWIMEIDSQLKEKGIKQKSEGRSFFTGFYKKSGWKKKVFE
jgi:hypothetical protein